MLFSSVVFTCAFSVYLLRCSAIVVSWGRVCNGDRFVVDADYYFSGRAQSFLFHEASLVSCNIPRQVYAFVVFECFFVESSYLAFV